MMGTLAIVATLVGAIVTTIDGTNVCYINFRKQNQRIRECWKNIVEDIKDGELLLCLNHVYYNSRECVENLIHACLSTPVLSTPVSSTVISSTQRFLLAAVSHTLLKFNVQFNVL